MEKTAQRLNSLVDVNTVIGKPVFTASGAQIIPFTKVTMGYLSGGGEYGDVKAIKEDECYPFAGASSGFLIDDGTCCRLVKVSDDPLDGLMEKASELIARFASGEPNA